MKEHIFFKAVIIIFIYIAMNHTKKIKIIKIQMNFFALFAINYLIFLFQLYLKINQISLY